MRCTRRDRKCVGRTQRSAHHPSAFKNQPICNGRWASVYEYVWARVLHFSFWNASDRVCVRVDAANGIEWGNDPTPTWESVCIGIYKYSSDMHTNHIEFGTSEKKSKL